MAVNVPSGNRLEGDLARCTTHESNDVWPSVLEIVAYWSQDGSRKGKRRSVTISSDEFFGRKGYNAPISSERLFQIIDRLRKGQE